MKLIASLEDECVACVYEWLMDEVKTKQNDDKKKTNRRRRIERRFLQCNVHERYITIQQRIRDEV